MNILFPADPLNPKVVDSAFEGERDAAIAAGHSCSIVDLEELARQGSPKFRGEVGEGRVLYRGWMVSIEQYERLWDWVLNMYNDRLFNGPSSYEFSYKFPRWYVALEKDTPFSLWYTPFGLGTTDFPSIAKRVVEEWVRGPVFVKDFVKSQKYYWHEACYIPDASDVEAVEKVISRFIQLQGDSLVGGIVVRRFEDFTKLGEGHGGFPYIDEYRAFLHHGECFHVSHMWQPDMPKPDMEFIAKVGKTLQDLPFVALDVARRVDGQWRVIEVGDGGVSSMPRDVARFYEGLATLTVEP